MITSIDLQTLSGVNLLRVAREITDSQLLKQLLQIDEPVLCVTIAKNIHTDKETLSYLYQKYRGRVVWHLAKNQATPYEILRDIIMKITQSWEAEEILENPCLLPEDIDMLLDKFPLPEVRMKVIKNPNTTGKTLIKAAGDDKEYIYRILLTGKVKLVEVVDETTN